jgi:hypothetical protein
MQLPSTFAAVPGFLKANPTFLYGGIVGLVTVVGVIIWIATRKSSASAALTAPVAASAPPPAARPPTFVMRVPAAHGAGVGAARSGAWSFSRVA